jgi:hypothetical protein
VVRKDGVAQIGFGIQEKSRELRAALGCLIFLGKFGNGVSA